MTLNEFKEIINGYGWSRFNDTSVETVEGKTVSGVCKCISTHKTGIQITYSEEFTYYNYCLEGGDYHCWNSEYSFYKLPEIIDEDGFVLCEDELAEYLHDLSFFKSISVDADVHFN
jgi:hypothetical protein